MFSFIPGDITYQVSPIQVSACKSIHSSLCFLLGCKLHKGKPAMTAIKLLGEAQALKLRRQKPRQQEKVRHVRREKMDGK